MFTKNFIKEMEKLLQKAVRDSLKDSINDGYFYDVILDSEELKNTVNKIAAEELDSNTELVNKIKEQLPEVLLEKLKNSV